jgi:hypothetical protein
MRNFQHSSGCLIISSVFRCHRGVGLTVLRQELGQDDVGGVWCVEPSVCHNSGKHVLLLVEVSIGVQTDPLTSDSDTLVGHPPGPRFTKWD